MNFFEWSYNLVKLIIGNPLGKLGALITCSGLSMLYEPLWLAPFDAILNEKFNLKYARDSISYTAWILILIGILLLIYNAKQKEINENDDSSKEIDYLNDNHQAELFLIGNVDNNYVYLNEISSHHIDIDNIDKSLLLRLFVKEFTSHPILNEIDYTSIPVPLKNDLFAIISRRNNIITIEEINKSAPNKDLVIIWKGLSSKYLEAYRLPYRENRQALVNRLEYNRTKNIISALIEILHKYISESAIYNNPELHTRLHSLKNKVILYYQKSDVSYMRYINNIDPEENYSQTILNLEMAISCVHKIILEYSPPH